MQGEATSALGGVMRDVRFAFGELFRGYKLDADQEMTIEVLFGLLGGLAQADGLVTSEEAAFVNRLMDELELSTRARELANDAFLRGRRKQLDIDAEIARFLARYPKGTPEVTRLYDSVVRLAAADLRLRPGERVFLERFTAGLGFSPVALDVKLKQVMPAAPPKT